MKKVLLYQPGRFGDILYVIPIARRLMEKGYKVFFPVYKSRYDAFKDNFPDINFYILDPNHPEQLVHNSYVNTPYEPCILLPLWEGANWKKKKGVYTGDMLMTCKYEMYNEAFNDNIDPCTYWHNLTWRRNNEKENKVMEILGIKEGEKYVLINEIYAFGQTTPIEVNTDLKKIYWKSIPGYNMFDWSKVIENAHEIHCVDTSVLYIIDRLAKTDKLHRYRRTNEDVEIGQLFSNKYVKHRVDGSIEDGV